MARVRSMKEASLIALTILRRTLGYGILVTVTAFIALAVFVLNNRDDLSVWHEADLDEEFTTRSKIHDFEGYLALEDRLFRQLEEEVYAKTQPGDSTTLNRYRKGSLMDPLSKETNWNRTFQLEHQQPTCGVLLLHGMSDSPYSLRHLGDRFHEAGASVIGLRIPGHGTAPCGLVETSWKDMAAAVRLAAKHLKQTVGDQPIHVVGYSNGGALALIYATDSMKEPDLPRPDSLILLSPEIAVSKAAGLAVWQARLGHWLGLEKLAWNTITAEYDPFKYGSFAVNAGDQAHRITAEIDKRLAKLAAKDALKDFPRVLTFQSGVDATVSAPALVSRLFDRLPDNGHELVLFDVNRVTVIEHLLKNDPADHFQSLLRKQVHPFNLRILTNASVAGEPTLDVEIKARMAGDDSVSIEVPGMSWPRDTFSLSHVALPFPADDPLYGSGADDEITLGNLALRGERGVLVISPGEMLRQKWNPFYQWLEDHAIRFSGVDEHPEQNPPSR